ncbi:hypothetical protein C2869_10310 [Saccharobesus litoralis]|uniref:Uncharacterized protein n=1 Tax=Saccharobesus litoralis TaxID=2172099 RepID=A0A2S0VRF1_9ALTE|nr:hypothetical protein C2869_10310 [Saccharobesus litoralis]
MITQAGLVKQPALASQPTQNHCRAEFISANTRFVDVKSTLVNLANGYKFNRLNVLVLFPERNAQLNHSHNLLSLVMFLTIFRLNKQLQAELVEVLLLSNLLTLRLLRAQCESDHQCFQLIKTKLKRY